MKSFARWNVNWTWRSNRCRKSIGKRKEARSNDGARLRLREGSTKMIWHKKNRTWHHRQYPLRPFGIAHLLIGGVMVLCDLLLYLILFHISPPLAHAMSWMFIVFIGATAVPLLLGTSLLQARRHPYTDEERTDQ